MDRAELRTLNDIADAAASNMAAGAAVTFEDRTPAEVHLGGARVVLWVFRMVDGRLHELCSDYRADRRDLEAVIERDTRELIERL